MSCVPLIAYFVDLLATLLAQYGYLTQKLTHLNSEKDNDNTHYFLKK
jgi:hypothetical protein